MLTFRGRGMLIDEIYWCRSGDGDRKCCRRRWLTMPPMPYAGKMRPIRAMAVFVYSFPINEMRCVNVFMVGRLYRSKPSKCIGVEMNCMAQGTVNWLIVSARDLDIDKRESCSAKWSIPDLSCRHACTQSVHIWACMSMFMFTYAVICIDRCNVMCSHTPRWMWCMCSHSHRWMWWMCIVYVSMHIKTIL